MIKPVKRQRVLTPGNIRQFEKKLTEQSQRLAAKHVWKPKAIRHPTGKLVKKRVMMVEWRNEDDSLRAIAILVHGEYTFFPDQEPYAAVHKMGKNKKWRSSGRVIYIRHLPIHPNRFG